MTERIEGLRDIVRQWDAEERRRRRSDALFFALCASASFLIGGTVWAWIAGGKGVLAVVGEYMIYRSRLLLFAFDNRARHTGAP